MQDAIPGVVQTPGTPLMDRAPRRPATTEADDGGRGIEKVVVRRDRYK